MEIRELEREAVGCRYRVVVLELMYQMLRETHGLQRRCLTLTGSSGRSLRRLLTALISLTPTLNKLVYIHIL